MRDINRIDTFCDELKKQWKKYPDYRFGQMMINVFTEIAHSGRDPFFPEDDEMINYIVEHMSRISKDE